MKHKYNTRFFFVIGLMNDDLLLILSLVLVIDRRRSGARKVSYFSQFKCNRDETVGCRPTTERKSLLFASDLNYFQSSILVEVNL